MKFLKDNREVLIVIAAVVGMFVMSAAIGFTMRGAAL